MDIIYFYIAIFISFINIGIFIEVLCMYNLLTFVSILQILWALGDFYIDGRRVFFSFRG